MAVKPHFLQFHEGTFSSKKAVDAAFSSAKRFLRLSATLSTRRETIQPELEKISTCIQTNFLVCALGDVLTVERDWPFYTHRRLSDHSVCIF